MTFIIIIIFLFSFFFTFENKPINLLLDFIGIIISLSYYLILSSIYIDLSYISFILIIIYGSALAILFAFIIMLFNNKNFKNKPIKWINIIIIIFIFILYNYNYNYIIYNYSNVMLGMGIPKIIFSLYIYKFFSIILIINLLLLGLISVIFILI